MVGLQIEWVVCIAMTWGGSQINMGLQISVQINLVMGLRIDLGSYGSALIYGGHGCYLEILWGG